MKLATYNLRLGGKTRVHWIRLIDELGVDLALFQESYPHQEHLPPLFFPDAANRAAWERVGRTRWGSAVFSKDGLVTPVPVPGFSGSVVGAEISGASWQARLPDPLLVFSIHAPTGAWTYSSVVNRLLEAIRSVSRGREVIVGGDFNLTVSHWAGSDRPVVKADLAIQARLSEELGLMNCWQEANPDRPLQQTLRWHRDPTTPYHCDGLFVPKAWKDRLISCVVLSGGSWEPLSDHNPVIAEFH